MAGGAKLACYPALGIVEEAQGAPGGKGRSSRTTCQHHCNHGSVQDKALGLYAFNGERLDRGDDGRKTRDVQPPKNAVPVRSARVPKELVGGGSKLMSLVDFEFIELTAVL